MFNKIQFAKAKSLFDLDFTIFVVFNVWTTYLLARWKYSNYDPLYQLLHLELTKYSSKYSMQTIIIIRSLSFDFIIFNVFNHISFSQIRVFTLRSTISIVLSTTYKIFIKIQYAKAKSLFDLDFSIFLFSTCGPRICSRDGSKYTTIYDINRYIWN